MTLLDNMPHECRIDRLSYRLDGVGGDLPDPQQVAVKQPCWVQNASQREIILAEKRDQRVTHKVFFPTAPPLRVGDVITITKAEPDILGAVLKFQAEADRSAGLGLLFGAMCELEENPQHAAFIPS